MQNMESEAFSIMNNRLIVTFIFVFIPTFCWSQSKGLKYSDDLRPEVTLSKTKTLYNNDDKRCFIVAIGVKEFKDKNIPQLNFPDNDCNSFTEAIR